MSTTVFFVALQCCQCSTMQVKQRNKKSKSSNKWTCVVCNQKQSVGKVFAQGSMANQLRPFVQSFNMSRHHSEQQIIHHEEEEEEEEENHQLMKKPRIDWSDYLDDPNENISHAKKIKAQDEENGHHHDVGDLGPKILTELPMELFNKKTLPKSKCEEETGCKRRMSEEKSKWRVTREEDEDDHKPRRNGRGISKWKDYITEEEEEGDIDQRPRFSNGRFAYHHHGATTLTDHDDDRTVEDDVHPDFM